MQNKGGRHFLVVVGLFIAIAFLASQSLAAVQQTPYTMSPFVLEFPFMESLFNDSTSFNESDYPIGGGNLTFYVRLSRNATVNSAYFDVQGKIVPIYSRQATPDGLQGMDIGNVTSNPGNEIATGSDGSKMLLLNSTSYWIWNFSVGIDDAYDVAIGNVTNDPGNEVVVGSDELYVLNQSGDLAWSFTDGGYIYDVAIGNVTNDPGNEIAAGSNDNYFYLVNSSGGHVWNYSTGADVSGVFIENITNTAGNEVVVGSDNVYVLNGSGGLEWSYTLTGDTALSVYAGNLTNDPGNEVVVGTVNGYVYVLNSSGSHVWNFSAGDDAYDVAIGDVTDEIDNEVVAGSRNNYIYTLNSSGGIVWTYLASEEIRGIAIGNLTNDPGNEVAAGSKSGYIHAFNFDYFPSNLSIDVGGNGTYDWNVSGKLRTTITTGDLASAFNYHLQNTCTESPCNITVIFNSDNVGKLNVSDINISFNYNASHVVSVTNVSAWSRTVGVSANETVGNYTTRISYTGYPEYLLNVSYIRINDGATSCDFNGTTGTVETVNGSNVCNVNNFTVPLSGSLPSTADLWDDTMDASVPFIINETDLGFTNETDNFFWRKNATIWDLSGGTVFYNISANASVDDPSVTGNEFLNVTWGASVCNITPGSATATCDSGSPAYTASSCGGGTFYVCKEDTDSDGVVDFFRWIQPNTASGTSWIYQVGGETDSLPNLSDANVTPNQSYWGDWFNYSVHVNDTDGDNVSVRMWYYLENQSSWFYYEEENVTQNGTLWFNTTSAQGWIGSNSYKFQYADFNSSGHQIHGWRNTSVSSGPEVTKRDPLVMHMYGDGQPVNRSSAIRLVVQVNDTVTGTNVSSGVNVTFWVMYNDSVWAPGNQTVTNSSGQCYYDFTPDGNYSVGNLTWRAGVLSDPLYNDTNSSDFNVTVGGLVSIHFTTPLDNYTIYRNGSNYIEARILDQYGMEVGVAGYNCSLFVSGEFINESETNSSGYCNFTWEPDCNTSFQVGYHVMDINLSDEPVSNYSIENSSDSITVKVKDELEITMWNPPALALYNKGGSVPLNSTVNDSCLQCGSGYNVTWFVKWRGWFYVDVNETAGFDRNDEVVIINGSLLQENNIQFGHWEISKTRVYYGGNLLTSDVLPWNDSGKTSLNESQVYVNNLSELVFVIDLPANTNRTFRVEFNTTAPSDQNISFMENSGFESGLAYPWTCIRYNCDPAFKPACICEILSEGTEENGSYSLYLSAESSGQDNGNIMGANISVARNITVNYITAKYKAWGTFGDGSYIRINAGSGSCTLTAPNASQAAAQWRTQTCYSTGFNGAEFMNVTVHDHGDGGSGQEASHVYIDYVCLSDSSGNCINHDGNLRGEIRSQTGIHDQTNGTWNIGDYEDVGLRTVVANASGEFYVTGLENRDVLIYGWSNLSGINISSNHCTYNESGFICMKNATLNLVCNVTDYNTSLPVYGHNVSYFDENGAFIGSNTTGTDGLAVFRWVNSSDVAGEHNWTCNITDDGNVFYNDTENNELWMSFNISTGNTTGVLYQQPQATESATGVNTSNNHSFVMNITLQNTGGSSMYNITISVNATTGVFYNTPTCSPLLPSATCQRNITVNVTYLADPGNYGIDVNVTWQNADATPGNVSNSTPLYIESNTILDIVQDEINYTIARGGSFEAGNLTVHAPGNTQLLNVTFTESGGDAASIVQWRSYEPQNLTSVAKGSVSNTTISLSVPEDTALGVYTTSVYANASDSVCSPASECWDYLTLNVNVTDQDWRVNYENFSKSIGPTPVNGSFYPYLIVTNNKDASYSFVLTRGGNLTYTSLSNTSFTLTSYQSKTILIYHNTSTGYEEGPYGFNITVNCTTPNAVPSEMNVSVTLTVINLSVTIISPNTTSPAGPLNASQAINIVVNASLSGNNSVLENNITWTVNVGGRNCTGLTSSYNNITELWSLSCNAPSITGNPLLADLNVTGHYSEGGLNISDIQANAVRYNDITPPGINSFTLAGTDFEGNILNGSVSAMNFLVNITDNDFVNTSWASVLYPNGTTLTYYLYNTSNDDWRFNFTNPDQVGDYVVTVYANDSAGNQNSTEMPDGYFDVYTTIQFLGYVTDKNNITMAANFSLYRVSSGWKIHSFATNSSSNNFFNWTLHNREYDMMIQVGQENITFYNASARYSARTQHNVSDPQNWTDPLGFDWFPNKTSTGISKFTLPNTAKNILLGFAVDIRNLTYTSAYVTIDYESALAPWLQTTTDTSESKFEVLYCSSWDFYSRVCGTGTTDFSYLNRDLNPNISGSSFSFPVSGFSAYAIAQACTNAQGALIDCSGYEPPGDDTPGGSPGGSSSSGTTTVTTTVTDTFPFTVTTDIGNVRVHPGENKTYAFTIKNKRTASNITVDLDVYGLEDLVIPESTTVYLNANQTKTVLITVSVPEGMGTGTYTGGIKATSGTKELDVPITMTVSLEGSRFLTMILEMITKTVDPYGTLRFSVELRNTGFAKEFNVTLVYSIKNANTGETVREMNETVFLKDTVGFRKAIDMRGNVWEFGDYYLDVYAYFGEGNMYSVNEIEVFTVTIPFWESEIGRVMLAIIVASAIIGFGYFGRKWYMKWRIEKARYIFPVNYGKIPQDIGDSFWIGKIAETNRKAWFNPDDLTTHAIMAGSTGAGKSVGASVFVEEALERKIPVIVFDPTAQWTGFVKAVNDERLISRYPEFGMSKRDAKAYKGLIYEVNDPHMRVDLKKYMIPGEVTVFTMNKLRAGEYDIAVQNIVDSIFAAPWEESTSLKMIIVFDEVHRLLEKYGGKGGYVYLEKACREFRKWGIGLIMCSQVLADFKEVIAGNVLTDIQFNTKSIVDINKAKSKYGEVYAERISRQGVGVGMVQNPKYNEGKPYFIQFRPTWHNPHKISDEEMETYKKFERQLDVIGNKIEDMKSANQDVFDVELEFKLASDKLKRGQFRMAQIYITSLQQHLGIRGEENER